MRMNVKRAVERFGRKLNRAVDENSRDNAYLAAVKCRGNIYGTIRGTMSAVAWLLATIIDSIPESQIDEFIETVKHDLEDLNGRNPDDDGKEETNGD